LFTRCLVCGTPFPANESLEYFPRGERVAFDPEKGRLWAVCRSCKRWSLAPIQDRWEALEELEKLVTDRARLLHQTDNVALLRAGPLEIVRVGRANLSEEAWWRYGRELRQRRESYKRLTFVGTVAVGAAAWGGLATGGLGWLGAWLLWEHAPDKVTQAVRWMRFGGAAWRGKRRCERCGYRFTAMAYRDRNRLIILPSETHPGTLGLTQRCPRCGGRGDADEGGLNLAGAEAERTLRRVLAYHHFAGASERRVESATRLIQEAGSASHATKLLVRDGKPLGRLRRTGAIALEIAANEHAEQRMLELELADLEARWREEEELAAIIDGELTPLPLLETLRLKATGRG
jgi:hypothetical protein